MTQNHRQGPILPKRTNSFLTSASELFLSCPPLKSVEIIFALKSKEKPRNERKLYIIIGKDRYFPNVIFKQKMTKIYLTSALTFVPLYLNLLKKVVTFTCNLNKRTEKFSLIRETKETISP